LLPALNKARSRAKSINCLSNLKQIGTALSLYSGDHKDYLPAVFLGFGSALPGGYRKWAWYVRLIEEKYMPGKDNFICPATPDTRVYTGTDWKDVSYGMNKIMTRPTESHGYCYTKWSYITRPSQTVLIGDRTNQYDYDALHFAAGGTDYQYGFVMDVYTIGCKPYFRHPGETANFIFGDGHGGSLSYEEHAEKFGTGWGDWNYWGYSTKAALP